MAMACDACGEKYARHTGGGIQSAPLTLPSPGELMAFAASGRFPGPHQGPISLDLCRSCIKKTLDFLGVSTVAESAGGGPRLPNGGAMTEDEIERLLATEAAEGR